MTEPVTPSPTWQTDSDKLWYAVRGLAEAGVLETLNRISGRVSESDLELIRFVIGKTATTTLITLLTAGWLRDEPTVAFEDTGFETVAKTAEARLTAWQNPGMS